MAVPSKHFALPIPEGVSEDVACMFGCSALTAYNACIKLKTSMDRAQKATGARHTCCEHVTTSR